MIQKHILIVGGTGMLAGVTSCLASEHLVTVIGRDQEKMAKVVRQNPETCHPLVVDYRNEEDLSKGLQESIKRHGPFKQVIAWVHKDSGKAMQLILNHSLHADVLHILGSQTNPEHEKKALNISEHQTYRQVQLGAKQDGDNFRWLTHDEIVHGVIDAIEHSFDYQLLGQLVNKRGMNG
ncbi:hypothetical protein ACFQO8_06795 [Exiguobacterium aestuarii]|uniref:Short-chain dehydrogenase n=1 Tax=Exiguobacterium aestuarii TaxID=273527 RepID=A0ABW2PLA7_9BACL|nr:MULTISPECIES: hypothetical protein [Exiguobacterium]MCT4784794.1 hypothetical protein [Exiguobacterium aestuarii]